MLQKPIHGKIQSRRQQNTPLVIKIPGDCYAMVLPSVFGGIIAVVYLTQILDQATLWPDKTKGVNA